jgi:hypothetical protein
MKPIEYLYLDNFRGFEKCLIPFRQVTFLLGENSSGKSSVLSMLNLVRNFSFWGEADFDTDNQHLGGFGDLVTEGSGANTFTIGTARYSQLHGDKEKNKAPFVLFATFDNVEGLARLANITYFIEGLAVQTFIEADTVYRRILEFGKSDVSDELSREVILKIADWHKSPVVSESEKIDFPDSQRRISGGILFHFSMFETPKQLPTGKVAPDFKFRRDLYSLVGAQRDAVWLAPIRTKPRRTYDGTKKPFSSEGDHTPYLLKKQLSTKTSAKRFRELIADLGRDSHLFEDIKIRPFGRGDGSPFEVQVKLGGLALSISNVGYGVSQILPILVEVVTRPANTAFHIQQPEVHLHPRAQAALGNLLYLLAREERKSFVIETHSDFLIDRYRNAMRLETGNSDKSVDTSVIFFSRKKSRNNALELCLGQKGEYPDNQPKEFREFFIQEQFRSLGI